MYFRYLTIHAVNCLTCFNRFLNGVELAEGEDVKFDFDEKDNTYSMTLLGNIKDKSGPVKVIAKNIAGEASCNAKLTVRGRAPTFIEKPAKCTILEGF